jgi:hypothetical protein
VERGTGERAKVVLIKRFWVALMLRSIILEAPIRQVCEAFHVARGTLQVSLPVESTRSPFCPRQYLLTSAHTHVGSKLCSYACDR